MVTAGAVPSEANAPSRDAEKRRVRKLQDELMALYRQDPSKAWVVDGAQTRSGGDYPSDLLHAECAVGLRNPMPFVSGVAHEVGGLGDLPVPGDLLCAALATCTDSTIRLVANRLRIRLEDLSVCVTGGCDVRGTLCVDASVPVQFQGLDVKVTMRVAHGTDERLVKILLGAAEHCCVVLQTLRNGVAVSVAADVSQTAATAAAE